MNGRKTGVVFGVALFPWALAVACSSRSPAFVRPPPPDAALDAPVGLRPADALPPPPPEDSRVDRLRSHGGGVLSALRLVIIALGTRGDDAAPDVAAQVGALVRSTYWSTLAQYGVGAGAVVGSVVVSRAAAFGGLAKGSVITAPELAAYVHHLVHPGEPPDASAVGDADAAPSATDAGDASPGAVVPPVPHGDAYLVFLPTGINVSLGARGSTVYETCLGVAGYHDYDGEEPFAVIAPCAIGRNIASISHELSEMATDPVLSSGWYSDSDVGNGGGEVADLCSDRATDLEAMQSTPSPLWSNRDGQCVAAP